MAEENEKKETEKTEAKKPAHKVIVQKIIKHHDEMKEIKDVSTNDASPFLKSILDIAYAQRIIVLLEVLKEMIIPDAMLGELIETMEIQDEPNPMKQSIPEFVEKLKKI